MWRFVSLVGIMLVGLYLSSSFIRFHKYSNFVCPASPLIQRITVTIALSQRAHFLPGYTSQNLTDAWILVKAKVWSMSDVNFEYTSSDKIVLMDNLCSPDRKHSWIALWTWASRSTKWPWRRRESPSELHPDGLIDTSKRAQKNFFYYWSKGISAHVHHLPKETLERVHWREGEFFHF